MSCHNSFESRLLQSSSWRQQGLILMSHIWNDSFVTRMKQISERGWWIRFWLSEKKSNTFLLFKGGKVVNALFARVGGNSRSESVKRWFRLGVRCVWTLYNILWIQLNLAHGKQSFVPSVKTKLSRQKLASEQDVMSHVWWKYYTDIMQEMHCWICRAAGFKKSWSRYSQRRVCVCLSTPWFNTD